MKWTIRETNIFIGLGKRNNQTGILIDKTFVFIGFLTKSPISRLKSATFKTSKIGLNKSLFKKKKSAITQTLTQPDASDRLFTRAEVAEYLNIGTTFIEQLRRQGKLPSYRLSGKCIRYKKSDCDVLLDHCFIVRPAKSAKKGEI